MDGDNWHEAGFVGDDIPPFAHADVPRSAAFEDVAVLSTRILISVSEIMSGYIFCGRMYAACTNTDSLCMARWPPLFLSTRLLMTLAGATICSMKEVDAPGGI